MQLQQFEEQVNSSKIYSDVLQQFLSNSGTGGLVSTNPKPSVAQVKSTQMIESRFADVFYGQFQNFMNIVFKKYAKLAYTWNFHIQGNHPHDFYAFVDLRKKDRSLVVPIPGYSTHTCVGYLSPLYDWNEELLK